VSHRRDAFGSYAHGMASPGIPEAIRGSLDGVVDSEVGGWAFDAASSTSLVDVEVLIDGEVVGRALADRYRPDLAEAGIGDGRCAFALSIAVDDWRDGLPHEVRARATGTDLELDGSPRQVVIGTPPENGRPLAPFAVDTVLARSGSLDAVRERLAARGRLGIMACFQPSGTPASHLTAYLEALHEHDVAVVLVDTTPGGMAVPAGLAPLVLHRENLGWDFASWLAGLHEVRELVPDTRELVLTNDSVFGPLYPLSESWENDRLDGADFWGLTDSWSVAYHLQSYFVVLRHGALAHPAFWEFLEQYPFPRGKRQVVRDGEIGLTTALHRAGLRSAVTCPYDEVARAWLDDLPARLERVGAYPENAFMEVGDLDRALNTFSSAQSLRQILETAHQIRRGLALNGSHHFWDTLVEQFRFPFVKRELLQVNPAEIAFATELRRVLAGTGYDIEHIRDAARRARDVRVVTV
jgi:hypothetical protein